MKIRLFQFVMINCLLLSPVFNFKVIGQTYYNQSAAYIKGNSVWPFIGDGTGLDFNTAPPGVATTCNNGFFMEGFASVSDPVTGQLLFYSDGERCWNASNVVMQNGDSLLGNSWALSGSGGAMSYGSGGSTIQGVCIVPFINQPGKYYLFSLNGPTNWLGITAPDYYLFYSVIDMSLDGGLGGIVPGQKNIPLSSMNRPLSESMIAVPGNNCDIWLIVHDYIDANFRSYHITTQGVDTNAVISATGSQIQGAAGYGAYFMGCMAISPGRDYLTITSGDGTNFNGAKGALLCKFDASVGIVSDALQYGNSSLINPWGVAFSPDNSKVYTSQFTGGSCQIVQFDISTFNAVTITATQQVINSNSFNGTTLFLKSYNGKIYDGNSALFLNVINMPNLPGLASNFVNADPNLPCTAFGVFLPNDVVFAFPPDTVSMREDTIICIKNGAYENISIIAPAGFYGYLWDDGSLGMSRSITVPGTYWVLCKDSCHSLIDTILVQSVDVPLDLGNDTVLCNGASLKWDIARAGSSYLWQDGSMHSNYTTRDSGIYWAQLSFADCVVRDTVHISTISVKQDLGEDVVLCKGEKLTVPVPLYAHVPPGAEALWSNGSSDTFITVTDTGKYWVTVTAATCAGSDTLSVAEELCNCRTGIPNAFSPNHDGQNDVFQPVIEIGCPVKGYVLSIYNRYGTRIFTAYNPNEGWDGTYATGTPADIGTYMFELSFTGGTKQNKYYKKGDLTLVR